MVSLEDKRLIRNVSFLVGGFVLACGGLYGHNLSQVSGIPHDGKLSVKGNKIVGTKRTGHLKYQTFKIGTDGQNAVVCNYNLRMIGRDQKICCFGSKDKGETNYFTTRKYPDDGGMGVGNWVDEKKNRGEPGTEDMFSSCDNYIKQLMQTAKPLMNRD